MKTTSSRQFRSSAIDKSVPSLTQTTALAIVFALTLVTIPAAQAQTFSVIHTFTGSGGDGQSRNPGSP